MACSCRSSAYAAAEVATGTTRERLPGVRIILSPEPRSMVSRGRAAASVLIGGRGRGTEPHWNGQVALEVGNGGDMEAAKAFFAAEKPLEEAAAKYANLRRRRSKRNK
jgi:hypothetical protein